jgi:aromatic-L-amino-acid decarboxylase
VIKAAAIAGFPARSIRTVPVDGLRRMRPDALVQRVREDRSGGLRPFLVVASAGTADTGSVDPIGALADVCDDEELWLHVDAAYGGFFRLTERGRATLAGIERADSITLDPHKGMFLPYGTGSLVVKQGRLLREAHQSRGAYLQDLPGEQELPNFSEYGPELSRDFRGLRVWLPLRLHGVNAFRTALDEKLDLARLLFEGLSEVPQLKLPWEPALTVVPFRLNAEGGDVEAANDRDRTLMERINASQRVFLSSTLVDGRFTIRACILCLRTHRDRVEECVEIVGAAASGIGG